MLGYIKLLVLALAPIIVGIKCDKFLFLLA